MKRTTFIIVFIVSQVGLLVAQIHKHSMRIQLLYAKQKNESQKNYLVLKRQELIQRLYALQDRSAIKEYAVQELHMQPVTLNQIKKMPERYDKQNQ